MSREGQRLRVLLVEDSESDAELLIEALRRGGYDPDWERVQTEDELRRILQRREWDIVFCDFSLPGFDAMGALRTLRETGSDLPVIVVSGKVSEEFAVEALKTGASDFLLKHNLTRLIPAVKRELREAESRLARRLSEAKRRHAEDALRLSEERYRVLFERNPIPMWVYDRRTYRFLQVNDAAAEHYGYAREEFWSMTVLDLRPQEDVLAFLASAVERRNDGPMSREIVRHRKKDGTTIFAELVTQPITYSGVKARIAQALDITERKRGEEELLRIKAAVEFAGDTIAVYDGAGRTIYLNRAHVDLFGYTAEQLNALGGPNALFLNRGVAEQVGSKVQSSGAWTGEALFRTNSGRVVELFLRANSVKNTQGEVTAYIGVGSDLGQMKRAEQTIAEQAALLDQAQDAIAVHDLRGSVTYWNKGAERIYGWAAAEVLGKHVQELVAYEPALYEEAMGRMLREGAWNGDSRLRTKSGAEVLVASRWTLVRDQFGDPKSVLVIETDITEAKKTEAQFLRAQRMESIGTLASGIAHDLNNVLGPIIMAVDLFKLKMSDPGDLDLLETVEISARRGADMVKQVLSFARGLDGRRLLLEPGRLLKEVQKIARETFPKSITVKAVAEPGTWNLYGDPTQLHQVLLNLAVNARDAMPNGGELRLTARNVHVDAQFATMVPEACAGDFVVLEVTDDGEGMPPEVIAKIFDPFFTTKDVGKGTGLGLSTTLAIVRAHGGFVTVESTPGQGTAFKIHLPAEVDGGPVPDRATTEELPRGNGEWVLVIDDEASVRSITSQTLEAFGYRVRTAPDGAAGIAEYAQHSAEIALVLTDMMMPVMDGMATIRALMVLNPDVKIIAASGFSAKGSEADAVKLGVLAFLSKPYTAATLLQTLRDLLRPPV